MTEEKMQADFLTKRMIELREKNKKLQVDMAKIIGCDVSTISRVESGHCSYNNILRFAKEYCEKLGLNEQQKELFLRGNKVVVTDTSALLKNVQLIDELSKEYSKVIVPQIVLNELDHIKDCNKNGQGVKAWQIIKSVGGNRDIEVTPLGKEQGNRTNDHKIIQIAEQAAEKYHCKVDIITNDVGFSARLSGHATVNALFLENYMVTKQNLTDLDSLKKLDAYYADTYDDVEYLLNITLSRQEINAWLPDGNTLIISTVRKKKVPLLQRTEKIKWLIAHGADVNKRDCGKYYFPPLSHAIQMKDFNIFCFLLHECKADPNVGSRNMQKAGKIMQKNEGNMPLMIAAWENQTAFVKELCADKRTSLNQQDANGFTALIKACYWGFWECRDILLMAGADEKIVDRDGYTAKDRYEEWLKTGRKKQDVYKRQSHRKKW